MHDMPTHEATHVRNCFGIGSHGLSKRCATGFDVLVSKVGLRADDKHTVLEDHRSFGDECQD